MSSSAIAVKRLRRQWEPDEKTWDDGALEVPWEELTPPLHKATVFALKNVFFFSHATLVQSRAISVFAASGNSVLMEAPTGSGKTLAALIPLMERTVRACDAYVEAHGRPLLRRDVIGVILSPSRVLAEQTFVVGRDLAARFPHAIRFALCDGAVQSAAEALGAMKKAARGAGTFLVTTPHDLADFIAAWGAERTSGGDDAEKKAADGHAVELRGCHTERFVFVVDEADFVFRSAEMQAIVTEFISAHACTEEPPLKRQKTTFFASTSPARVAMDVAFVGATVSTSPQLQEYTAQIGATLGTTLHTVVLNNNNDFVTKLQNRYVVCEAREFLPLLIHLMNTHASKKHFIFFNSAKTLRFVEKLFACLMESECPLLYIKHVFVMYEGMSERARLEQYSAFLHHDAATQQPNARKKAATQPCSSTEKKNQVYVSGWKRDGRQPDGRGAILLCTDMAAFGLDVRDVDYVYHFEPPTTVQSYVHRIGRVGRMGMRGSSILFLPCFGEESSLASARERKTTSGRFNTIANTKHSTAGLRSGRMTLDDLSDEKLSYLRELCTRSELQPYSLPPCAPITSTIRNIIWQKKKLMALAKNAAMSMCVPPQDSEDATAWFDPKLALHALLLD